MYLLRQVLAAAAAAAFFSPVLAGGPAAELYGALVADAAKAPGHRLTVAVDLAASPGFSVDLEAERLLVRYRMGQNQVAEGWSWRPLANPESEDYYRYAYLPLQTVLEERGEFTHEDKIGEPQRMRVLWRFDYFFAFDNLYDFYPRTADDDAGFVADLPASASGRVGMRATLRLAAPSLAESTTVWKATHGRPADYTLKKRYLIGMLEGVEFFDTESGRTWCRVVAGESVCAAR